jgi:hypothetical protein
MFLFFMKRGSFIVYMFITLSAPPTIYMARIETNYIQPLAPRHPPTMKTAIASA